MILDKTVKIKVIGRTLKHYQNLGYEVKTKNIIVEVKIEHLSNKSSVKINVKCDICNNIKNIKYYSYVFNTKNLTDVYCCCKKCANQKIKNTCMEKYGIENYVNSGKAKQTKKALYGNENYNNRDKAKETNIKNFGVEHVLQNLEIRDKFKKTMIEKYNCEHALNNNIFIIKSKRTKKTKYDDENYNNREKSKITCLEKYEVKYPMQNNKIKEKSVETSLINWGVPHPMQNKDIFNKQQKSSCQVKKYKNTDLTYQGLYEKYFLELMEEKGLVNQVSKGKSYDYILDGKSHVYHSDYWFNDSVIEIKSAWTYNKNGKDLSLQLENDAKWQSVKDSKDNIIILKSKSEIKEFVKTIQN